MVKCCVFYVRSVFLNIIYTSFAFKGLMDSYIRLKYICLRARLSLCSVSLLTLRHNYLRGARTGRFITALTTARHQSLSWDNPIHPPPQDSLPKIHSDSILPPTPWSSERSLSLGPSHQPLVHFPLLSHACHMHRPPHSPWLYLPNDICGLVQITNWDMLKVNSNINPYHRILSVFSRCSSYNRNTWSVNKSEARYSTHHFLPRCISGFINDLQSLE
jgi:hypothetical protein